MFLTYLGPLCEGLAHPVAAEIDAERFPPSCYLVEVSAEAGVEGPVIEGDVLMVDESRPPRHDDLVVVATGEGLRLYRSHRLGGGARLVPAGGGQGRMADPRDCRGVVVRHLRAG